MTKITNSKIFGKAIEDASTYIDKQQWSLLASLIEKYCGSGDKKDKVLVKKWVAALPDDVRFGDNTLLWLAINLHSPYVSEATDYFSKAFQKSIEIKSYDDAFIFWFSYAKVKFYYLDRYSDLPGWLIKADELLLVAQSPKSDDIRSEFFTAYFNALMFAKPEKELLNTWYKKLSNELLRSKNCHIKTNIYNNLIFYNLRIGNMREARLLHKEALGLVHPDSQHPFNIIMQSNIFSMMSWLNLKPKKAIETAKVGISHADKVQIRTWHAQLYSQIVYSHICAGEFTLARKALKNVSAYKNKAQVLDNGQYHYLLGWLNLSENNLVDAKTHLVKALELSKEAGVLFSQAFMKISLAQLLILQGEHSTAVIHLAESQRIGKQMGSKSIRFGGLLIQSWGALVIGKNDLSSTYLKAALRLAAKEQYISIPGWPHKVMSFLLEKALHEGIETEYVKYLISKYKILQTGEYPNHPDWPWQIKMSYEFGFEVIIHGEVHVPQGKSQRKPLELIQLLSFYPKGLPKYKIANILYVENDAEKAMQSLDSTIFRARKLLQNKKAIVILKGKYCLNPQLCHSHLMELNGYLTKQIDSKSSLEPYELFQSVKMLCKSTGIVENDPELSWLVAEQELLRHRVIRYLNQCVLSVDNEKKVEVLQYILTLDEAAEKSYQNLIITFQTLDQDIEAYKVWLQCKEVFSRLYGQLPSRKIRDLIAS